jgi:ribosomal protein L7/L12
MTENEEIEKLRTEVAELRRLVDALLKHVGLSQNDLLSMQAGHPPADVIEALNAGNLIEAIKRWRAHTGVGLAEAKQAVEDLQRGLR